MDSAYWLNAWERGEIGFHRDQVHPFLVSHIQRLALPEGGRILVPLCGKSLDVGWLLEQGYEVIGVELSKQAVEELFKGLEVKPVVSVLTEEMRLYEGGGLRVFLGDIFHLTVEQLGAVVDGVYDRAALVAFSEVMHMKYTAHLRVLSREAPQLLISFDDPQKQFCKGPPFSVGSQELAIYYGGWGQVALLEERPIRGVTQGASKHSGDHTNEDAKEQAWLLTAKERSSSLGARENA